MATRETTKKELLERWGVIIREDDDEAFSSVDSLARQDQQRLKELWFSEAFSFLTCLPNDEHIWCAHWDLMGPMLETFYNYFEDDTLDSPLKCLWNRISREMKVCILCVRQHHQAREMYVTEYEEACVKPLLDVLCALDGQRISGQLKDLNGRISRGEYDIALDNQEVVCVMFEVFMFPSLLDDCSLAVEFEIFIEAIDDSYELALDGSQHYPGVYILLFSKRRRVRSIGLRLAGRMGKLRKATELDPLQHLLRKYIFILESEVMNSSDETSRSSMQLERTTVWIGIKALVGLLEPQAFEEGILDRYPAFLSVVLNNITDDLPEFSHAANLLRLLFEKLGCKLWFRAAISPSVMRNSLLGQCFHTSNEKSHKEIFDLFEPFLQSLEALQDGEHEKQRRHILYFLLHQVPVSSNFSTLMRKKARQLALLIVLRGYRMDPPCPPFECAHMWGPSLACSLKDGSLHNALRQPAFDLIQTIIVSDASAFVSVILEKHLHPSNHGVPNDIGDMDDEHGLISAVHMKESNTCWKEFMMQQKIISQADGSWICVPMLWFDVLVEIEPVVLPLSFSKTVFWALSQLPFLEPVNDREVFSSVRNWLETCASEVSHLFGWETLVTADDGGDVIVSKNSTGISEMCLSLLRTFKRLATHFAVRMEQGELKKQWAWEPMMGSSLILLLADPNDDTRQLGRQVLEQVSGIHGLIRGLEFMCSTPASMLAILSGLRHALKLIQLDSVLLNFRGLHHLFFIICKLLKSGISSQTSPRGPSDISPITKYSKHGGFLTQSIFDPLCFNDDKCSSTSSASWKMFSCLISEIAWSPLVKCLEVGKTFTGDPGSQMTCIRLLELLPVVLERLLQGSRAMVEILMRTKWLHELADWGTSSLGVVVRYWKQALASMMGQIREFWPVSSSLIFDIEKLISCENITVDELTDHVARLSVMLTDASLAKKDGMSSSSQSKVPSTMFRKSEIVQDVDPDAIHYKPPNNSMVDNLLILDDDEKELEVMDHVRPLDDSRRHSKGDNLAAADAVTRNLNADSNRTDNSPGAGVLASPEYTSGKTYSSTNRVTASSDDHQCAKRNKPSENKMIKTGSTTELANRTVCKESMNGASLSDENASSITCDSVSSRLVQPRINQHHKPHTEALREAADDSDGDTWGFSFSKPTKQPQLLNKRPSGTKRQVIQLNLTMESKPGSMRRGGGVRRFQFAKLDDCHKSILELDFFITVGITPQNNKEQEILSKLKEVPVSFHSSDEYIEIFRVLALQEFKAQMHNTYREMSHAEEMGCESLSVMSIEKVDDFHVVRFVQNENESVRSKSLCENDLILITRQPMQDHLNDIHALGKLERREKDSKAKLSILVIRMYLQGSSRLNQARKMLTARSKWHAKCIMNITPQLREFQALSSLRDIPLAPIILNPWNHLCNHYKSGTDNIKKLPGPLNRVLKTSYNESQLQAINVSMGPMDSRKDIELTLIQGPPGTGKTRTIVAIVNGLLGFCQINNSQRVRSITSVPLKNPKLTPTVDSSAAILKAWQNAALAREAHQDSTNNIQSTGNHSRGRILICAQSNAAVDELVARLCSEGLCGVDGQKYSPYIVRVGNPKTVHPNSLPFFIDTLVEDRIGKENRVNHDEACPDALNSLRTSLEKLVDQIRYYEAMRATTDDKNFEPTKSKVGETKVLSDAELKVKLRKLYESKKAIYSELAQVQARSRKAAEEIRALRHKFRTAILREAEIVVATLSGSGGDLYGACCDLSSCHKFSNAPEHTLFDAIVIDEAAQALEIASLIPLQLLKSMGSRCIMVGDPKQLPATVVSKIASKFLFQCSMFERLQKANYPVIMLAQQYRMHPEISHFPSLHFYDGKLLNGVGMPVKAKPYHNTPCLGPYVLFDVSDGHELRRKNAASFSLSNESEVNAALEILRFFKKSYPSEFRSSTIGVITPYKCQSSLFVSRFSDALGSSTAAAIEFNTVDGFQGREVDIMLLSTVRASGSCSEASDSDFNSLGFVADVRRMNVALTRAKSSLWIFGNVRTLQTNQSWAHLISDARSRNLIVPAKKPYSSIHCPGTRTTTSQKEGKVASSSGKAAAGAEKGSRSVTGAPLTSDSSCLSGGEQRDVGNAGRRKHSAGGGRTEHHRRRKHQRLKADEASAGDCQRNEVEDPGESDPTSQRKSTSAVESAKRSSSSGDHQLMKRKRP